MATKPGTLPRWATNLTNNDAPSSGQMDTGWTPGQDGVSDYDNYIKYWTYKWIEWLNSTNVDFGTNDVTMPSLKLSGVVSAPNITGDITVWDPAGTGNLNSVHTIVISSATDNYSIKGLVNGVNGQQIEIINTTSFNFGIKLNNASATTDFKGPSYWNTKPSYLSGNFIYLKGAGSTLRLRWRTGSGWDIVSTTGCYMFRKYTVPVSAYQNIGTHTYVSGQITTADSSAIGIPFTVPEYGEIVEYLVYVKKQSSGSNTLTTQLAYRDGNDAVNTVSTGVTDNQNNPGFIQTLKEGPYASNEGDLTPTSPSRAHWIIFTPGTTGFNDILLHTEIIVSQPI